MRSSCPSVLRGNQDRGNGQEQSNRNCPLRKAEKSFLHAECLAEYFPCRTLQGFQVNNLFPLGVSSQ